MFDKLPFSERQKLGQLNSHYTVSGITDSDPIDHTRLQTLYNYLFVLCVIATRHVLLCLAKIF